MLIGDLLDLDEGGLKVAAKDTVSILAVKPGVGRIRRSWASLQCATTVPPEKIAWRRNPAC
jgi:hypothetical protein